MYIVGNGKLITFDPAGVDSDCGAVAVDGARIAAVGELDRIRAAYTDAEFIDAEGGIIMPALADLLSHSRYSLLRSLAIPLYPKDESCRFFDPFLSRIDSMLCAEDLLAAAYANAIRCIRHGITSVFELQAPPLCGEGCLRLTASAYRECGIRSCLGCEVSDRLGARQAAAAIRENAEFAEFCQELDIELVRSAFGLGSATDLSDAALKAAVEANGGRTFFHFHAGITADEAPVSIRQHGLRPVERLARAGVLDSPCLAAGGFHLSSSELELIAAGCGSLVLTPHLSAALGTIPEQRLPWQQCSIRLLIGSDPFCARLKDASIHAYALLARAEAEKEPYTADTSRTAETAAANMLLFSNPAAASEVFGVRLGVLAKGAAADIIVLRPSPFMPVGEGALGAWRLVCSPDTRCELTMAAGRLLMRNGEILSADEALHAAEFGRRAAALARRMSEK